MATLREEVSSALIDLDATTSKAARDIHEIQNLWPQMMASASAEHVFLKAVAVAESSIQAFIESGRKFADFAIPDGSIVVDGAMKTATRLVHFRHELSDLRDLLSTTRFSSDDLHRAASVSANRIKIAISSVDFINQYLCKLAPDAFAERQFITECGNAIHRLGLLFETEGLAMRATIALRNGEDAKSLMEDLSIASPEAARLVHSFFTAPPAD